MLNLQNRTIYGEDHSIFRASVRKFIDQNIAPNMDRWEETGVVDRAVWQAAGAAGFLCPTVPEAFGGLGLNYLYNAVIDEEMAYCGSSVGFGLQSDIIADYIVNYGSDQQRMRWLPGMVSGEVISAIAMTEPGTGSDLQGIRTSARKVNGDYILKGSKTFISSGQLADVVIVVARTDPDAGARGISLFLVEANSPGFRRGRNLDKIGQKSADTSELFFDDIRLSPDCLLGKEGSGFGYLMGQLPQERLGIALSAQAGAQRAFDEALAYTKDRTAFGKPIKDFQNTRFSLATMAAKLQVGWAHIDWALGRHLEGKLTPEEGAAAKLWHTEMQWETVDAALQLHGGAGYMNEYPIARLWRDARVQRIYGGTSEIMKEIVGRSL